MRIIFHTWNFKPSAMALHTLTGGVGKSPIPGIHGWGLSYYKKSPKAYYTRKFKVVLVGADSRWRPGAWMPLCIANRRQETAPTFASRESSRRPN
ncbi:MAG: hypothetical protein ACK41Q_06030 [Candidatus Brocadia sp.]